jgi:hypothetical protein
MLSRGDENQLGWGLPAGERYEAEPDRHLAQAIGVRRRHQEVHVTGRRRRVRGQPQERPEQISLFQGGEEAVEHRMGRGATALLIGRLPGA